MDIFSVAFLVCAAAFFGGTLVIGLGLYSEFDVLNVSDRRCGSICGISSYLAGDEVRSAGSQGLMWRAES